MLLFWHLGAAQLVISRKACSGPSSPKTAPGIDGGPRLAGQHQRQQNDHAHLISPPPVVLIPQRLELLAPHPFVRSPACCRQRIMPDRPVRNVSGAP